MPSCLIAVLPGRRSGGRGLHRARRVAPFEAAASRDVLEHTVDVSSFLRIAGYASVVVPRLDPPALRGRGSNASFLQVLLAARALLPASAPCTRSTGTRWPRRSTSLSSASGQASLDDRRVDSLGAWLRARLLAPVGHLDGQSAQRAWISIPGLARIEGKLAAVRRSQASSRGWLPVYTFRPGGPDVAAERPTESLTHERLP